MTSVSGALDNALRAAQQLSSEHRSMFAVLDAGSGAWNVSPLDAMFAAGGGEYQSRSPRLTDASDLRGPLFGIGVGRLTAEGLRVERLTEALKAVVDGTTVLRFPA